MASARRAPTEQQASCRGPLAALQSLPWEVGVDHIGVLPAPSEAARAQVCDSSDHRERQSSAHCGFGCQAGDTSHWGSGLTAEMLCDLRGSPISESPPFHTPHSLLSTAGFQPWDCPASLEGCLDGWPHPGVVKGPLSWAPYSQPRLARPTIPSGPWGATG